MPPSYSCSFGFMCISCLSAVLALKVHGLSPVNTSTGLKQQSKSLQVCFPNSLFKDCPQEIVATAPGNKLLWPSLCVRNIGKQLGFSCRTPWSLSSGAVLKRQDKASYVSPTAGAHRTACLQTPLSDHVLSVAECRLHISPALPSRPELEAAPAV